MSGPTSVYRNPLLLTAAFLATGVAAAGSIFNASDLFIQVIAAVLFVGFGLIVGFYRSGDNWFHANRYLAVETAIATALIILLPQTDFPHILLSVMCVYAALLLPSRAAALWIGLYIVIAGLGLFRLFGLPGLGTLIGQVSSYFAFAVVGGALRQAESARRQSQTLLAELNEAHQKLQVYAVQSQKLAVAEERNRLARDLHDSVKQQAFALAAQLGAARSLLPRDLPAAAEARLVQAEHLSDTLRQELADMILELRPPVLDENGLALALRDYALDWSKQWNIPVEVIAPDSSRARPEVEQALFRIAQEALANIARHSRAGRVTIELAQRADVVKLRITDDGRGFDPQSIGNGVGLQSMRERVESLKGTISIASTPGRGTTIEVSTGAEHGG